MKKVTLVLVTIAGFVTLMSCNTTPETVATSVVATETVSAEEVKAEPVVEKGPAWEKSFYVDDFGDPTEDSYMSVQVEGVFSNSATENSELTAVLMVDGDFLNIQLYEYNSGPAQSFESGSGGIMKFKAGSEVITVNTIYDEGDAGVTATDLMIWEQGVSITENVASYLSKLQGKDNVKCVISVKETYGGKSSYSFNVPTKGLEAVLASI